MYEFTVDFHEGAIRLTVRERHGGLVGWMLKLLAGREWTRRTEVYMDRSSAIKLGRKLITQAAAVGRLVKEA